MIPTLIIGKDSNLSQEIYTKYKECILVSSRDVLNNIEVLFRFKNIEKNIIFNNFQPATQLNNYTCSSDYISNSILSTSLVLDYFKDTKINKIIYSSSSSVYGNNILCAENDELKPINLHASLKVANEKLIEKYCMEYNIDYTIARIFNMYGGDDKFSIVSKLINAAKNNTEITIVNNGNAVRDFIHIDDIVDIYIKLLNISDIKILNIGTGMGTSIKNILDFFNSNKINVKIQNIFKDELKISTANSKLLYDTFNKSSFIRVEEYLKKKFLL